jgi:tetraprenyl-beta-curcumene synthase
VRVGVRGLFSGGIAPAFVATAARYWLGVFPFACDEIHRWERRAGAIPDPLLRRLALQALRAERGNLEGAVAYAAFVPRLYRTVVACAAMAFQAAYDYADAISEEPGGAGPGRVRRLHQALSMALRPGVAHLDYHTGRDDGGYLNCLVERCRTSLRVLPSFPKVARQLQRAAARIITYQELNHGQAEVSYKAFAAWATGAAAGSSLLVFALMALAAQPIVRADRIAALESAYFPWVCSLHTLLDSLVDEYEDSATDQHSLTARYRSREEAAGRLHILATRAVRHTKALHQSDCHTMIVVAMVSFYLSAPQAREPHARLASEQVLHALGEHVGPAMLVLRARRAATWMGGHGRSHRDRRAGRRDALDK